MANLLAKLFPKTIDLIWADGFAMAKREAEQDRQRMSVAIRDLNQNWDWPKGTRREEAASLMLEQSAQLVESFK